MFCLLPWHQRVSFRGFRSHKSLGLTQLIPWFASHDNLFCFSPEKKDQIFRVGCEPRKKIRFFQFTGDDFSWNFGTKAPPIASKNTLLSSRNQKMFACGGHSASLNTTPKCREIMEETKGTTQMPSASTPGAPSWCSYTVRCFFILRTLNFTKTLMYHGVPENISFI